MKTCCRPILIFLLASLTAIANVSAATTTVYVNSWLKFPLITFVVQFLMFPGDYDDYDDDQRSLW
jgi:hypothetical protein